MSKQDNSKYDFYQRTGATPPEVQPHGTEEDLEGLRLRAGEHVHRWKQNGAYIECAVGPNTHGMATPSTNHILTGTSSDGRPLYKDLNNALTDG
jgi:hypothetical protein